MFRTSECCALASSALNMPCTSSRGDQKVRKSSGYVSRKRFSCLYCVSVLQSNGAGGCVGGVRADDLGIERGSLRVGAPALTVAGSMRSYAATDSDSTSRLTSVFEFGTNG